MTTLLAYAAESHNETDEDIWRNAFGVESESPTLDIAQGIYRDYRSACSGVHDEIIENIERQFFEACGNGSNGSKYTLPSDDVREIVSDPMGIFPGPPVEEPKGISIDGFFGSFLGFRLKNFAKRFSMERFRATFHSVRASTRLIRSREPAVEGSAPVHIEELNADHALRPEMLAGLTYSPSIYSRPAMNTPISTTSSLSINVQGGWDNSSALSAPPTENDVVTEEDDEDDASIISILDAYTIPSEHDPYASPRTMGFGDNSDVYSSTSHFDGTFAEHLDRALQTQIQYGINSSICDVCRKVSDLRYMPARFSFLNSRGLQDYIEDSDSSVEDVDSFYPGEGGPIYMHNPQRQLSPVLEASESEECFDMQERYQEKRDVYHRLASECMRKHGHYYLHARLQCSSCTPSPASTPTPCPTPRVRKYPELRRGCLGMDIDEDLIVDEFHGLYEDREGVSGYEDVDDGLSDVGSYSWLPRRRNDLSEEGDVSSGVEIGSASVYSGTRDAPEDAPPQFEKKKPQQQQQRGPRLKSWVDKVRKDPRYIWLGGLIAMFEMLFLESGSI
ncbi:hypothetical protein KEM56_007394 [Ascosphaera pollenicola]|nr:hypothetical protein KEM56_007394 [Ascosphaera pollenicola]